MNNTKKLIDTLRSRNIFEGYYKSGETIEVVENRIINTLRPFFHNYHNLKEYAINFLVSDYVNLIRIQSAYPSIECDIKQVLDTYATALKTDSKTLYNAFKQLTPNNIETGNRFWTFINLENDKSSLELYEFTKEVFDNIDDVIEGLMKYYIIENVIVNRIVRGKCFNIHKLKSQKMGVMVDELISHSSYAHLFRTEPEFLKLSMWRNVAAHHSYNIVNGEIICEYMMKNQKKYLAFSRADLYNRLCQIVRTMEVLNISHKFFGFDNIEHLAIQPHEYEGNSKGRDEIWLLFFVTRLNSLGFDVVQFDFETNGEAFLLVRDLTDMDPHIRGLHSSQFIYQIWYFTDSKHITVEYRQKNNDPYIISSSTSDVCQAISSGQKEFTYLAEKVKFQLIKK